MKNTNIANKLIILKLHEIFRCYKMYKFLLFISQQFCNARNRYVIIAPLLGNVIADVKSVSIINRRQGED